MNINLNTDLISKSFYQYLWPALTGMVIKSLFIISDGWFVSQQVGADGLGALSLVLPLFSGFTAIAMMIGVGGAARMSIELGQGHQQSGQAWFNQSLLIVILTSTTGVVLGMIFLNQIIAMMGAKGDMATLVYDFLIVLMPFLIFYAVGWVLSCFVRNDANPKLATYAMSIGAMTNLILDYILIIKLDMGMQGAAIATSIAQVIIFLILLSHFTRKQGALRLGLSRVELTKIKDIFSLGMPTFFIEVTAAMTLLLFNYVLLNQFGEKHIIAYGLTSNIGIFALFVMVGIAQACQPIISFNHGAKHLSNIDQTLSLGLKAAIGSGLVFLLLIWSMAPHIATWYFSGDEALIILAAKALSLFFLGVPLMGFNMVIANLFQAIAKPKQATLISVSRGFMFVVIGVLTLPQLFPDNGIWSSIVFAETLTALISLSMLIHYRHRRAALT
ncbi:MATE family efflux transporter [Vibrio ostreicida]|uniref:Multidrug export protein MepA n=1 Tax=Vibrio ostreicida TaxID=526588 RepID=A0ABT8BWG6_9VIBR|nr:MATE family efflux transporter [Vibrio ostreicida]MDN3610475.1 MATE family efflux transporter [Vibrio ostreicida]NPD07522.1 MATE family efflux transporter [Vibrio ostreicida]